jgi:hypothetical protein
MKKILLLIILTATFLVSCATTRPIKTEELDSNVFVVNKIIVKSATIQPTDEELVQIFGQLPYSELSDIVMEKKGILLDTSLINPEKIPNNIEYNLVYNLLTEEVIEELPEWELNLKTDDETDQFCTLIFSMDPPEGYLNAQAIMTTSQLIPAKKEGQEDKLVDLQSTVTYTFEKWTYKNIFVDPRSCALLKFNKNLTPTFIENEIYNVYKVLNTTDDGFLTVNVKDPVILRFNISDPGNIFFSPAEIYNAPLEYTFAPGKKYMIKYRLKRFSPDSSKWKVVFNVKEIKPKLTK